MYIYICIHVCIFIYLERGIRRNTYIYIYIYVCEYTYICCGPGAEAGGRAGDGGRAVRVGQAGWWAAGRRAAPGFFDPCL